jgi:hypothetical protein
MLIHVVVVFKCVSQATLEPKLESFGAVSNEMTRAN